MNKFKPGDKVRCNDAFNAAPYLVVGQEYTIGQYHPDDIMRNVSLKEVVPGGYQRWFLEDRFELISYVITAQQSVKNLSRECKCGIYRNDCEYHRE